MLIGLLVIAVGCRVKYAESYQGREIQIYTKGEVASIPRTYQVTIGAIGDILIHDRVYDDARIDNGFNFIPMVENVYSYLQEPDILTANQETMIGGEAFGLSGYPSFNSPHEVGDLLAYLNVDLVNLANNHTLDRGEAVIYAALNYWDELNIDYIGSYRSEEDRQQIRVIEKNTIKVAFLGYSYGTNGIRIPEGKEYLINLIDRQQITEDIRRAKEVSDAIVMHLHFGEEYVRMPNEAQRDLVQYLSNQGVDIIIGHHPHVLQPVEWIIGEGGQRTFVSYSLGNFLSGQDQLYRQIGGMVEITIEKTGSELTLKNPKFLPTYVELNHTVPHNYKMQPLYKVTESQLPDVKRHYHNIKDHMAQWVPHLEFIAD
ncbi:poly-gamma-glutamate synthesis protein (capsule biosynthesis protein) [Amphibacillus marinus]|uniref:Poly-gamma-glutamate synthesis protein (Capsule biosynthesis protein) n=2 Tax=Amphibacillus marinus TaxID=872970 RepID=A0A1H8JQL0_9BACI|nr:poly-gamma-glutamate synthesis protein (capsule biosynthesis protein) [Amphibacillus marinus]